MNNCVLRGLGLKNSSLCRSTRRLSTSAMNLIIGPESLLFVREPAPELSGIQLPRYWLTDSPSLVAFLLEPSVTTVDEDKAEE